jgi:hypothetical protein
VQNGSLSEPQPEGTWRYAAVGGQVLRVDGRVVRTISGRRERRWTPAGATPARNWFAPRPIRFFNSHAC